jgi:hypothetical protein
MKQKKIFIVLDDGIRIDNRKRLKHPPYFQNITSFSLTQLILCQKSVLADKCSSRTRLIVQIQFLLNESRCQNAFKYLILMLEKIFGEVISFNEEIF